MSLAQSVLLPEISKTKKKKKKEKEKKDVSVSVFLEIGNQPMLQIYAPDYVSIICMFGSGFCNRSAVRLILVDATSYIYVLVYAVCSATV